MMKLTTFLKLSSILTALSLAGCSSDVTSAAPGNGIHRVDLHASYNKPRTLENFQDYVNFLKGKAAAEGVSEAVLKAQNNINYIQKSVDLDDQQAGRIRKRDPKCTAGGQSQWHDQLLKSCVNTKQSRYCGLKILGATTATGKGESKIWRTEKLFDGVVGYGKQLRPLSRQV